MPASPSFSGLTAGNANVTGNVSASQFLVGANVGVTANIVIPAVATLQIVKGIVVGVV